MNFLSLLHIILGLTYYFSFCLPFLLPGICSFCEFSPSSCSVPLVLLSSLFYHSLTCLGTLEVAVLWLLWLPLVGAVSLLLLFATLQDFSLIFSSLLNFVHLILVPRNLCGCGLVSKYHFKVKFLSVLTSLTIHPKISVLLMRMIPSNFIIYFPKRRLRE